MDKINLSNHFRTVILKTPELSSEFFTHFLMKKNKEKKSKNINLLEEGSEIGTPDLDNLDVLFIFPPVFRIMGKKWNTYPLGLGYLTSTLDHIGIKSAIYHAGYLENDQDLNNDKFSFLTKHWTEYYNVISNPDHPIWSEIRDVIAQTNPPIIGITSCIIDIPVTNIIARIAKGINSQIKIIVGGPSATTFSRKLFENNDIDFLVIGEGEETVSQLTKTLLVHRNSTGSYPIFEIHNIKGLMYKNNEEIIFTGKRELIKNLDNIPFPNREKIFYCTTEKTLKKHILSSDILLSRGCPFRCKFCSCYTIWGTRKTRVRSNENIIEEIIFLKRKYKQTFFIFWDDLFTSNKQKVVDLCQKIIDLNLHIRWICLVRIDTIDLKLLRLMKKAGCIEIQVGIESGNDRILKYIGKGITINKIEIQSKIINKAKINWRIFLIIGFPEETEEDIFDTVKIINKIKPTYVDISIFSPYPGTELFDILDKDGLIDYEAYRSDTACIYHNYAHKIPRDRFIQIAEETFNYASDYNNKPLKRIVRYLQMKF